MEITNKRLSEINAKIIKINEELKSPMLNRKIKPVKFILRIVQPNVPH